MNYSLFTFLGMSLVILAFAWTANRCIDTYRSLVDQLNEMCLNLSSRLGEVDPDSVRREAALNVYRTLQKAKLEQETRSVFFGGPFKYS